MKKRTSILAITLILLLAMICTFTSCKKKKAEAEIEKAFNETIEISDSVVSAAEKDIGANIRVTLSKNVTAKVLEINDDTAKISITAPNMAKLLGEVFSADAEFEDAEQEYDRIKNYVNEKLQSGKFDYVTNEVTVEIQNGENGIEIIENDEYLDAINGGMISFYEKIAEEQESK